jgi:hypothetical protein
VVARTTMTMRATKAAGPMVRMVLEVMARAGGRRG